MKQLAYVNNYWNHYTQSHDVNKCYDKSKFKLNPYHFISPRRVAIETTALHNKTLI